MKRDRKEFYKCIFMYVDILHIHCTYKYTHRNVMYNVTTCHVCTYM